jgi:hypothetical protein
MARAAEGSLYLGATVGPARSFYPEGRRADTLFRCLSRPTPCPLNPTKVAGISSLQRVKRNLNCEGGPRQRRGLCLGAEEQQESTASRIQVHGKSPVRPSRKSPIEEVFWERQARAVLRRTRLDSEQPEPLCRNSRNTISSGRNLGQVLLHWEARNRQDRNNILLA